MKRTKDGYKFWWLWLFLIVITASVLNFLAYPEGINDRPSFIFNLSASSLSWISVWFVSHIISNQLNRLLPWTGRPVKRLIWSFLIMSLLSICIVGIFNYIYFASRFGLGGVISVGGGGVNIVQSFYHSVLYDELVALIVVLAYYSQHFFKQWEDSVIKTEAYKRNIIESELAALKEQLSPHFLFNSLNVLSSLVHKDPVLSERFIHELANVYRYLLDSKDKDMVLLEDELAFIKSYLFLMKIRFGDNLTYTCNISEQSNYHVVPMSVQILIENTIQHNIISKEQPLHVVIEIDNADYLKVDNNFQPRLSHTPTNGKGLENVRKRYEYLSNRPIDINQTADVFSVRIPLLLKGNYEAANY